MTTIVIMTSGFPFPGAEQFLESEIMFWGLSSDRVILLPATFGGSPRNVPPGIEIDVTLAEMRTRLMKLAFFVASPFANTFRHEVFYLRSIGNLSPRTLYQAARATSQTLLATRGLRKVADRCGRIDLVYSYWNDALSYGAVVSKRRGYVKHVVSRAHGEYDLYEEAHTNAYMPIKRQFINDFDVIFPISQHGHDYAARVYGLTPERNIVSRLGVHVPDRTTRVSDQGRCHIVSVSFCTPVKRIDKIVQALAVASQIMPEISFKWTHVGGGPLLPELQELGASILSSTSNMHHVFTGTMSHDEVLKFLLEEPIDLLINTSECEGIPVSIMEAMSCGIPAIAPDIGGVSELVGNGRGVLMGNLPEVDEIASHLAEFIIPAKGLKTRQMVREFVTVGFDEANNYGNFVEQCTQMAKQTDRVP